MLSYPLPWPFPGWTLLLIPRWGSFGLPGQIALHAAACLVPLTLVLWLYRYELKMVSWLGSAVLLFMRIVALAVLLFLVLLQPRFSWTRTWEEPGRVLVAVDRSGSMDVPDPQRKPVDKLRLALALHLNRGTDGAGILPCDDAEVQAWISAYGNDGSPPWMRDDKARADPTEREKLEKERVCHDKLCELADKVTRTQTADAVLSEDGLRRLFDRLEIHYPTDLKPGVTIGPDVLKALAAREGVELIGFNRGYWKVAADHPETLFDAAPSADAGFTALDEPLAHGLETVGVGQGRLLGVVVLTDGRHNTGDPPVEAALKLGERETPIYPVALGSEIAPAQTTLLAIQAPPAVYKDTSAGVDVRFRVAGLPRQDAELELYRGAGQDKTLLDKRVIHHDGKDREYVESFQVKMDVAGPQTLTAVVHPADPKVKLLNPENESRSAVVNVARDQARVLLIDGEARWEFHYLQSALKRDKTLQTESVVFDQPRLNPALTDDKLDKIGGPREHLPAGPDALSDYDCVVLGDVSPEQLPPADRKRLEQFVAERGGTLVVVAGHRYMPTAYAGLAADGGEADPIRKMLPIEKPRAVPPKDAPKEMLDQWTGFSPALTADGRETKFMDLEEDAAKSEQRWKDLPPQLWGVVGQAKPAAATLAYLAEGQADPADPTARERRNALIVRQNYGLGRVLYIGLDSTWRWRKGVGDLYHHRFWGQVMRWAADRPLETGNQYLRFGTSEAVYRSGQDVDLSVRFRDVKDAATAEPGAQAQILRRGGDGKPVAVVQLTRKAAQPNAFEAHVANLPEGDYEIQLKMDAAADKLLPTPGPDEPKPEGPLKATFSVTPPQSAEMTDLSMNRPLLEELASKSGGKVYTPEDVQSLVEDIKAKNAPQIQHSEEPAWQGWTGWAIFGVVVFLLTVEWVVRKFSGLP